MITIIIAVYNGKEFIKDTIESALNQSILVNVLVIDDCSTDGSFEYVDECFFGNERVQVLKNPYNLGFCRTVNKGVELAISEYVLILGQDDILLPNHCETMLKYFDENTSLVFCDYDLIDENGITYETKNHCEHKEIFVHDFYHDNAIPSVGLIMRRDTLLDVGGYPENNEFPQYGEYHTWIRMALAGKVVFCDEVRAKYRRHKTNMTNNFNDKKVKKKLNRYFNLCKRQILKSDQVSIRDKAYVVLRMFYDTMKVNILGR